MPNQQQEQAFAQDLFRRLGINPENIVSRERPDLVFTLNGTMVGMEITESTPSEYHWGHKIAHDHDINLAKPIFFSTSRLRDHGRQRTRDEVFHDMFNNPICVDMVEQRRDWCEDVRTQWARKRAKLNEAEYERFEENWLLIWDNKGLGDDYSTLANIQDQVLGTQFFGEEGNEFDHVYVLSGNYTFDFIPGRVAFFHENAQEVNAIFSES